MGFTVIATPYAVTFRHDECAGQLHAAFTSALTLLQGDRQLRWAAPAGAPVHGVGHSNGALMHAMIASMCAPANSANALISFNNRQVGEAVPVPLSPLQVALQPLRASQPLEATAQAATDLALEAARGLPGLDPETLRMLRGMAPAVWQLGSVFDEVGAGAVDFSPSPEQNRQLIAAFYRVPRTLLVQYADDGIDQSPMLEELLTRRGVGAVERAVLPGNHLTPVGPAAGYGVAEGSFSPLDALAQAALALAQKDMRVTGQRVGQWLAGQNKA